MHFFLLAQTQTWALNYSETHCQNWEATWLQRNLCWTGKLPFCPPPPICPICCIYEKKGRGFFQQVSFVVLVFFLLWEGREPKSVLIWLLKTADKSVPLVLEKVLFDLLIQALPNCVSKASRNWPGTFLLWHLSIIAFNAFHKVIQYTEDEREMPAVWLRVYLKSNIYIYIYISLH